MSDPNNTNHIACDVTVGSLIEILKDYPEDARFNVCGDDLFYIHADADGSTVNVDSEGTVGYPEDM